MADAAPPNKHTEDALQREGSVSMSTVPPEAGPAMGSTNMCVSAAADAALHFIMKRTSV
jgi:hypothetical protein